MPPQDSVPLRKNVQRIMVDVYWRDDHLGKGPSMSVYNGHGTELWRFDMFETGAHVHRDPQGQNEVFHAPPGRDGMDWGFAYLRDFLSHMLATNKPGK